MLSKEGRYWANMACSSAQMESRGKLPRTYFFGAPNAGLHVAVMPGFKGWLGTHEGRSILLDPSNFELNAELRAIRGCYDDR